MNRITAMLLLFILHGCASVGASGTVDELASKSAPVFQLHFAEAQHGPYTGEDLARDAGGIDWPRIAERARIEVDAERSKVLRVAFPKGSVGPEQGGIQFVKSLPAAEEYYLDYYVRFGEGFDFVKGGKLPGLTSGGARFTGGRHPDDGEGWSARYMWVGGGEIIVYFYYMDMQGKWGDSVRTNTNFEPGRWYRLTQHIKLNDGDQSNGIMEVWVDGRKVISNTDVRYRLAPLGMIDSFYFSTFHGGNTPDWAPRSDSYVYFDDFTVSTGKPDDL